LNLVARIELLGDQMVHHYSETTIQRLVVNGGKSFTRFTLIEQAYAFEQRKLESRDLSMPISSLLALFFQSVDQHINQWITTSEVVLSDQVRVIKQNTPPHTHTPPYQQQGEDIYMIITFCVIWQVA